MAIWGLLAGLLKMILIAATTTALNRMMAKKKPKDRAAGVVSNVQSNDEPLKLIYGETRVNTNQIYKVSSGTDNSYLHIIGIIGEGPINGIFCEDGTIFNTPATQMPYDRFSINHALVYMDGELWTKDWSTRAYMEYFDGSDDQTVCATLNAAIPTWTDPMRNTAYIYLRLTYDEDLVNVEPDVTVVVSGLKLYDPTALTTAVSNNPALVCYDMITRPSCRGGMGLDNWHAAPPSDPRVDIDWVEACRSYCATKGWTFNASISEDNYFIDNLQLVLNCFRGSMIYSEGMFKLRFLDMNYEGSAVMDLTEDDTIDDGSKSTLTLSPRVDMFDLPNTVEAQYIAKDINYIRETYTYSDQDALDADGDQRTETVELLGLSLDNVQKMCNYYLERWRWGLKASVSVRDRALSLEAMDLVTLTHTMPGWTEHDMRVISTGFDPRTNAMQLILEEEDIDLYDDDYDPAELTDESTNLPRATDPIPSVINVVSSEEVYYYRGRSFTRFKIDFDRPSSEYSLFWKHAEIWIRKGGTGDYKHITSVTTDYEIDPVEEGEEYDIKLRSVSVYGQKESLDTCWRVNHTIIGVTGVPTNLSGMSAIVNGDSVSIYADPVSDPDIDGYEVRLGTLWDGALFISFNKAPSLRLTGVRPGTHTFWLSPVRLGVNGSRIYSGTPVSATCTVFIPAGITVPAFDTWTWDFNSIGTHDNTEYVLHNAVDAMKCSHTSDVLTGDWTSPSRDLGSLQKVRIWGEFSTDFVATDTTFDGVGGETLSFDELDGETNSFNEIFEPSAAGQLQVTLQHSTDDSTFYDIDRFEIMCAEVSARYLRVVITITDPTLDSNLYLYELPMKAHTGPQ